MTTSGAPSSCPDFSSMSPADVMSFRFSAIESLDFESAAAAEAHFANVRDSASSAAVSEVQTDLHDKLEQAIALYRENCSKTESHFRLRILDIRMTADVSFQKWRHRHIDELHEIEKSYALTVLREQDRPVPEELELLRYSRRLALASEYTASIQTRELAKASRDPEFARRREKIDARFARLRDTALARQKGDLRGLNEKLNHELKRVQMELASELDSQKRKFVATVRLMRQKAIAKATAACLSRDQKLEITETISLEVEERVQEITGIDIGASSPSVRAKRDANQRSRNRHSLSHAGSAETQRRDQILDEDELPG